MADKTGYIGRNPGDSSVVIATQTYAVTSTQTDFTFASGYTVGYLDVYLNGARLIALTDYSAADGSTVTLTVAAINGDVLEFVAYKAFNLGNVTTAGGNFSVGQNLIVGGTYNIGIHSAGTEIASEVKNLNFVGTGNTLVYDSSTNTVDISIAGGGGSGIGTPLSDVKTEPGNQFYTTPRNITISTGTSFYATASVQEGGVVFSKLGKIHVATGATVHVGSGTTLALDVLRIFE